MTGPGSSNGYPAARDSNNTQTHITTFWSTWQPGTRRTAAMWPLTARRVPTVGRCPCLGPSDPPAEILDIASGSGYIARPGNPLGIAWRPSISPLPCSMCSSTMPQPGVPRWMPVSGMRWSPLSPRKLRCRDQPGTCSGRSVSEPGRWSAGESFCDRGAGLWRWTASGSHAGTGRRRRTTALRRALHRRNQSRTSPLCVSTGPSRSSACSVGSRFRQPRCRTRRRTSPRGGRGVPHHRNQTVKGRLSRACSAPVHVSTAGDQHDLRHQPEGRWAAARLWGLRATVPTLTSAAPRRLLNKAGFRRKFGIASSGHVRPKRRHKEG